MEVRPGYKQTEVGVIPEDWEVKPLGTVAGYTNGKAHEGSISDFGKYVVVNSKFISTAGEVKKYSNQRFSPALKGEILMVMSDVPNGRAIARCFFVDRDDLYTVNQRICALRPLHVDGRLLLYRLNRNPFYLAFDDGVKQTNLRKDDVLSCPLALPSTKAEHEAIAVALTDADALIESLEQLLTKKRQIKKGAMQELLPGKQRLSGFRGEWEVKRLGEFVSIRNQKALPSGLDVDTLCIELDHIGQGDGRLFEYSAAQYSTSSKYRFCSGDVLFGRLRSYLRKFWLADRNGICSTEIWPLMVDPEQARSDFLYAIVQSDEFIATANISYGTHMPRADWDIVRNFSVSLPKPKEQTAIATILSDMDAEITALEAKLSKAHQIKQGMMQELLTGRIRLL